MTAARATVATIYNPQKQTKQELIDSFVVRKKTFKKIYDDIRKSRMEHPEQHYLIEGKRGMGKTSLLLRLAYAVEDDPDLNPWLVPLVFNEEEYSIRRLFKLWERVIELLEDKDPSFHFGEYELKRLGAQYPDDDAYEHAVFDWLLNELHAKGKKLILFIDNFGDIAQRFTDEEAHRLRKILQTCPDIRIIGGSAAVFELFYRYDQPFYEFFKVVRLEGLSSEETRELLLQLSEHYKKVTVRKIVQENPGRVEALRRITGGVVRTIILLFEIFADEEDGSAFRDLETILDRVTPLYKHRMDDLSSQQQAIVEVIALNWDGISVKEITERTRLESKAISAQLSGLEKNGIVRKIPTGSKNHLYQIEERFFNIWYLMRLGRKADQRRVLWLVRFFEDWCVGEELKSRVVNHILAIQKDGYYDRSAYFISEALAGVYGIDLILQHELLKTTKLHLQKTGSQMAYAVSESELDVAYKSCVEYHNGKKEDFASWVEKAQKDNRWSDLLDVRNYTALSNQCFLSQVIDLKYNKILFHLGVYFAVAKESEKATHCFTIAAYNKDPYSTFMLIGKNTSNISLHQENTIREFAEKGNFLAFIAINDHYLKNNELEKREALLHDRKIKDNEGNKITIAYNNFQNKVFKKESLEIIQNLSLLVHVFYASLYSKINLWNDQFDIAFSYFNGWLSQIENYHNTYDDELTSIFLLLLAKNQTQYLYDLFTGEKGRQLELKDRFKPIWYALLKRRDDPEYLRMGEELRETVEEILAKADQMAVDYA